MKTSELDIFTSLMCKTSTNTDWEHVVKLLDNFEHEDNGAKLGCMDYTALRLFKFEGHSIELAIEVVKQVLLGLIFLHSQGFVHGDVHTGNSSADVHARTKSLMTHPESPSST